ncbi:hypothetical protein CRYUN_Cryun01aG0105600 [Craigia yunnanensis]
MIQDFRKERKLVPSDVIVKLKIEPDLILVLDCSEGEMTRRLLNRNQGRVDDNIDTIKKRLKVYSECTPPVIDYYNAKGKVRKIDGEKSINDVSREVKGVFTKLDKGQEQSKT